MGSGRGWLAGNWPSTGGVLTITAAAWSAGFQWWRSGDITRTQNVSEYMLVLALCLVYCWFLPVSGESSSLECLRMRSLSVSACLYLLYASFVIVLRWIAVYLSFRNRRW